MGKIGCDARWDATNLQIFEKGTEREGLYTPSGCSTALDLLAKVPGDEVMRHFYMPFGSIAPQPCDMTVSEASYRRL